MDWNTLLSYGAELALTDVQMAALKNIYDKTKDIRMVDKRSNIFIVPFVHRMPIRKEILGRR